MLQGRAALSHTGRMADRQTAGPPYDTNTLLCK